VHYQFSQYADKSSRHSEKTKWSVCKSVILNNLFINGMLMCSLALHDSLIFIEIFIQATLTEIYQKIALQKYTNINSQQTNTENIPNY